MLLCCHLNKRQRHTKNLFDAEYKKIRYASKTSKRVRVSRIYDYIHDTLATGTGKVLFSGSLNIEETEPDAVIAEMTWLAEHSKRSKMPVQHWILSLSEGERWTPESAKDSVEILLRQLGYEGCQVVYACHGNTDNMHIHVLINRVDPEKKNCRSDSHDVEKAHKAAALICEKHGFSTEENCRYVAQDGEVVRAKHEPEGGVKISDKARAAEVHSGAKSAERIAAEVIAPRLMAGAKLRVKSWKELHEAIAQEGFEYAPKGGGAVFRMHVDGDVVEIKASALHRKLTLKNAEKVLGLFVAGNEQVVERHAEALDGVPQEVVDQYEAEKKEKGREGKAETEKLEKAIEEEKEQKKKDFQLIQVESWKGKRLEVAALMRGVKEYHEERIDALKKRRRELLTVVQRPKIISIDEWAREQRLPDADMIAQAITRSGNFVPFAPALDSLGYIGVEGLAADAMQRMRQGGLRPACVVGDKCIFKLDQKHDARVLRKAAELLARRYGGTPLETVLPSETSGGIDTWGDPCALLTQYCDGLDRYYERKREVMLENQQLYIMRKRQKLTLNKTTQHMR